MRFIPFRAHTQADPSNQPEPIAADLSVVRTVIGYAPAPPALLRGAMAEDAAVTAHIATTAPIGLSPVLLPVEIFDAEELLG